MQFLTDFADQAVTIPLAVCAGLALALVGWQRGAAAWAACAGLCWGTMLALKLVFAVCGPGPGLDALADPSGHTASGTFVYAGLAALLLGRAAALPAAVLAALVIGASRVSLGVHSLPDVVVGGAVGVSCVQALAALAGPRPPLSLSPATTILVIAPLMLHGAHLEAEESIRRSASAYAIWPLTLCLARAPVADLAWPHGSPASEASRNPPSSLAFAHF